MSYLAEFDWSAVTSAFSDVAKTVATTYGQVEQAKAQAAVAKAQAKNPFFNVGRDIGVQPYTGYPGTTGGMSTNTILLLGAAAVAVFMLSKRKRNN